MNNPLSIKDVCNFFTNSLQAQKTAGSVTLFYHSRNERIAKDILFSEQNHLAWLKTFYRVNFNPKIFIFLYPNKREMEKGFKRRLPNANCCFAPVKGKVSLIAFTALNSLDSLDHILVHETSHIYFNYVTGNYEINNIQQIVPVWLDEGVALYLDNRFRKNVYELNKKRFSVFQENSAKLLPLTKMYTYFNRLDKNHEFGPRGIVAYVYSYFCVLYLIRMAGEEEFMKFLKKLLINKDFSKVFRETFSFSVQSFDKKVKNYLLTANDYLIM